MSESPNNVNFAWVENTAGPEGMITLFECECGNVVIDSCRDGDDGRFVEVHSWDRENLDVVECGVCGTVWKSHWEGITFTPEDTDNE